MSALRVGFPLEGLPPSGGVRVLVTVANGLAERGHEVTVIVPDYAAECPWPLRSRVRTIVVATGRNERGRRARYLVHLARHAARGYDALYATGYKTPWLLSPARLAARRRTALLYFLQGHDALTATEHAPPVVRSLLRLAGEVGYRLPARCVAVSRWVAEQVGRPDADIVPNGIDPGVFRVRDAQPTRAAHEPFVVAVVGSAAPNKGYAVLLDAIASLPAEVRARMLLRVCGFSSVPLPGGVRAEWVGSLTDEGMADFYASADAFVFPSFRDGFGLPVLEAMACGTPTIATRCGGVEEFANERNALLVPTGAPGAIAAALRALMDDAGLRQRLRAGGLATAARLTEDRMCDAHDAVLRDACRSVARPPVATR